MKTLKQRVVRTLNMLLSLIAVCGVLLAVSACAAPSAPNIVPAENLAYELNNDYEPGSDFGSKYKNVVVAGESYDPVKQKIDQIAVIPYGKVGLLGNRILVSGSYPRIRDRDVRKVDAANVNAASLGIYYEAGLYKILSPGVHEIPADKVVITPVGLLRYRTLVESLVNDPIACSSYKCETTLTGATVSGTSVTASIDVDVLFEFKIDETTAKRLFELRDIGTVVQNYIGSSLRSARTLSEILTEKQMETTVGRAQLEVLYLKRLQGAVGGEPLIIRSVNIRSIAVGDQQYRATQAALEQKLNEERNKAALLALELTNLSAANKLESEKNDFKRMQALLDAESQAAQYVKKLEPFKGVSDWRIVALMLNKDFTVTQEDLRAPQSPR